MDFIPAYSWCIPLLVIFLLASLSSPVMAEASLASPGDTVSVYYSLSYPGGPIFETNVNDTPLSFILGSGAMIHGFDHAIIGMAPGETKTVILPPSDAYGEKNESLIQTVPLQEATRMLSALPMEHVTFSLLPGYPGPIIEYAPPEGKRQRYLITNITNETVVLDTNKPLVGKDLQFVITLDVVNSTP